MPGKRVNIDDETWMVLDLLARDRMATFQELADEAFADLLKKHGRPVGPEGGAAQERGRLRRGGQAEAAQEAGPSRRQQGAALGRAGRAARTRLGNCAGMP